MPKIELLNEKVRDSGMTITAIANKCGVSRANLYNRLKGKGDFTASEIVGLTKVLRLTKSERDDIFLT